MGFSNQTWIAIRDTLHDSAVGITFPKLVTVLSGCLPVVGLRIEVDDAPRIVGEFVARVVVFEEVGPVKDGRIIERVV